MAFQKVMISGINTADLTVLKEEEKMALLREIRDTGSKAAKDKLIQGNLRLVLSVIQRFTGRGEDIDDLFQIGVVGLIKAINNFDLSKEVRFSTYCVPMISGELRRYLRDFNQIKVSRSLRDLAYQAMQAKERLTTNLQKEPTVSEIAAEIGAKREDVAVALESVSEPVSIYEPVYSESGVKAARGSECAEKYCSRSSIPCSSPAPKITRISRFPVTPASFSALRQYSATTAGPLSSATPRPNHRPSCFVSVKGSVFQPVPAGTTSTCAKTASYSSLLPQEA